MGRTGEQARPVFEFSPMPGLEREPYDGKPAMRPSIRLTLSLLTLVALLWAVPSLANSLSHASEKMVDMANARAAGRSLNCVGQESMSRARVSGRKNSPITTVSAATATGYQRPK